MMLPEERELKILEEQYRILQDKIASLKHDLENQSEEKRRFKMWCTVADAYHKATCHNNHIDQCGYEYESWDYEDFSKSLNHVNNSIKWVYGMRKQKSASMFTVLRMAYTLDPKWENETQTAENLIKLFDIMRGR